MSASSGMRMRVACWCDRSLQGKIHCSTITIFWTIQTTQSFCRCYDASRSVRQGLQTWFRRRDTAVSTFNVLTEGSLSWAPSPDPDTPGAAWQPQQHSPIRKLMQYCGIASRCYVPCTLERGGRVGDLARVTPRARAYNWVMIQNYSVSESRIERGTHLMQVTTQLTHYSVYTLLKYRHWHANLIFKAPSWRPKTETLEIW